MCNCRNTYPLSVQLRMAAMDFACKTAGHAEPTDSTVTAAKRFETFLLGDYTSQQLDEPPKAPTMGQAYRAHVIQELTAINVIDVSEHSQKALADWVSGYSK